MIPAFDILAALGVLSCASIALIARDRIAAIAAFILMGLLVSLAWVRLGAPDVALAEAAIGAGLTGALFLRSVRCIGPIRERATSAVTHGGSACLALALAGAVAWMFANGLSVPVYPGLVGATIEQSGVSNPVTAVLLNFRAWDTLLEIAVLCVALLLVAGLASAGVAPAPVGELVIPFAGIVVPVTVLLAGHLLWQGASAPGGAFQAAAVLTGGGLALALGGHVPLAAGLDRAMFRIGLAGLAVFLVAALGAAALTGGLLQYPVDAAKLWIVAIESALTLSIAATLFLLFAGPSRSAPR